MTAQQQSLETLLGISSQRKSLKQQLDAASIKAESGRTTLADLPTVQIGCKRSHMITEADGNAYEDSSRADSQPPSKRRCLELPTARSNVNKAKELTVGWIVTANLPFTAPSNPYLRRMLDLHDASLAKEVPWSRQSVRDTMRKLFEVKKGAISCQLEMAVTKISFSFDMWTSPNRYAFLGLHAHYLDASYQVQSRLLALRRVWGAHSGDNQATTIYDIFGECFGHILNLAARAFLWGEDPDSFEREAFTEAAFQVEERELRLWRKRGAVGKLHNIVRFVRASPQRRELMKSLACSQRDEDDYHLFEEDRAAIDLELMQNNETRWNSTFMMIQRAIRKREQIDHFITYLDTKAAEPRQRVPVQDHLSQQDWLLLAEIQSLPKPLYEITMRCQGWAKEGRYGALWEVMIGMEYLLNFFEEQKLIFSPPDGTADELQIARASATTRCIPPRADQGRGREKHLPQHTRDEYTGAFSQAESLDDDHRRCIQISINNCWSKLDEYYSLLGQSPLCPAAVILHPRWNVSWLEANWTSHEQLVWLRDAKNSVREFFEQQYPRKEQPEAARTMIGKAMRQDEPSQFDQWMQSCDRCMMEEEDELGVYMR
ncbi:transposase-like protein [Fusarium oxysporum f. sp. phaseoli]